MNKTLLGEISKNHKTITLRSPEVSDGVTVWEFIRNVGTMDLNSAYCYMMLCDYFQNTCVIAEAEGELVGFVSAFQPPAKPDTLFVWQIAVSASQRGKGLSKALLEELISRWKHDDILFIEATVSPSNTPSQALFNGVARRYDTGVEVSRGYSSEFFPAGISHEDEELYRVGPIKKKGRG